MGQLYTLIMKETEFVLTHETGHVVGLPHFAGGWPPENINFVLQDGTTMGYHTLNNSQAEINFMGAWNSYYGRISRRSLRCFSSWNRNRKLVFNKTSDDL